MQACSPEFESSGLMWKLCSLRGCNCSALMRRCGLKTIKRIWKLKGQLNWRMQRKNSRDPVSNKAETKTNSSGGSLILHACTYLSAFMYMESHTDTRAHAHACPHSHMHTSRKRRENIRKEREPTGLDFWLSCEVSPSHQFHPG